MRVIFPNLSDIESSAWDKAKHMLTDELRRLQSTINTCWDVAHNVDGTQKAGVAGSTLGQLNGTLAEQPTGLSAVNDGLLYFVSDYGRLVRWNASVSAWEDAPGTLPGGIIQTFAVAPTGTGWVLCDGGATTRLVVGGATLTTAAFTTPNLTGSPAYLKTGAAYAGISAASGTTASDGVDHTHGGVTGGPNAHISIYEKDPPDFTEFSPSDTHTHNFTTGGASAYNHTHGFGTLDPAHLTVLPYFKR